MSTNRPSVAGYTVLGTYNNIGVSQTAAPLIAAQTGRAIRVHSLVITAGTATSSVFTSSETTISGTFWSAANGGAVLPHNPTGWFETAKGSALGVTTSAGGTTGYTLTYSLTE